MKTVWKHPFSNTLSLTLLLPEGAMVRHAGVDPAVPYQRIALWVERDTELPETVRRTFYACDTGAPIRPFRAFIGTVIIPPEVWHIYEE